MNKYKWSIRTINCIFFFHSSLFIGKIYIFAPASFILPQVNGTTGGRMYKAFLPPGESREEEKYLKIWNINVSSLGWKVSALKETKRDDTTDIPC